MKVIRGLCYVFVWICMILTAALMLLMVAEVLSRAIINRAILGSTEWAQVLLVCTLSSFGASILCNYQVKIDVLTSHFSPRAQVILDVIIRLLTVATIAFLAYRQGAYAIKSYNQGVYYNNIKMPQWPFVALFSLSYGVAALTSLLLAIRKLISLFNGTYEQEAALEDTDPIFAYGKWRDFNEAEAAAQSDAIEAGSKIEQPETIDAINKDGGDDSESKS